MEKGNEMLWIVTVEINGEIFYLRNTVWTSAKERCAVWLTEEDAKAALRRAKQFMHIKVFRAAKITHP